LIFRDQRNTDAALIAALRKSLQLNIRLAAEYATLFERNAKPKSADADRNT
jgi:hypothetical protein